MTTPVYPQSGSTLTPTPAAGLSTQITVKVGRATVGALQELTINQIRQIKRHEEIGTSGIVDSHPTNATQVNLSITRLVFDQLRLPEAFSRGFMNLQAQRFPFDIQVIDRFAGGGELAVVHTYHSCWFTRYTTPYRAENFIVSESAEIWCEDATSMQNGVNVPFGGLRGIPVEVDSIERNTDLIGRPGRLDSAGFRSVPLR